MSNVNDLLEQTTFKKILSGKACDFVDRLCYKVTVAMLVVFAAIVSTKQFVGEPIHCWVPAQFKESWHKKYVNHQCWVKNTYYVPFFADVEMPKDLDERMVTEFSYYQWVPVLLLLLALLFVLPHLLYRTLTSTAGINLSRIADLADEYVGANKDDRESTIESLGFFIDKWLCLKDQKKKINWYNQLEGRYLVVFYLLVKFAYLGLIVGTFLILRAFLGLDDFFSYGTGMVAGLAGNQLPKDSPVFPRVTFCDVPLRQLENVITYTVQCVLPINLFNEKMFVFLWFWLLFLGLLTLGNTIKWTFTFIMKDTNYTFIKKHLLQCRHGKSEEAGQQLCRRFAESYIGDDGCFLFRMMSINSSDLVVSTVIDYLWGMYLEQNRKNYT